MSSEVVIVVVRGGRCGTGGRGCGHQRGWVIGSSRTGGVAQEIVVVVVIAVKVLIVVLVGGNIVTVGGRGVVVVTP